MNHINKYRQFLLLLLFVSIGTVLSAQNIQVTGTVTDKLGPMAGVNIVLKGTQTGTMTDMDGKYSIQVPATGVLEFTFLGYNTQTVNVNSRKIIHVSMEESSQALDEVVVVGYGTIKKSDISGSVVSVDKEQMMKRNPLNLAQGLQGSAAGVMVSKNSGDPEGTATIRIRGVATVNGSADPLYVVDGVQDQLCKSSRCGKHRSLERRFRHRYLRCPWCERCRYDHNEERGERCNSAQLLC